MVEFIPEELIIEILSRSPVKALLRFTTVCKPWYSLIISSNFIIKHHNQTISNQQSPLLMLSRSLRAYPSRTKINNHLSLHIDNTNFDQFDDILFPQNFQGVSNCRVSGVCNGLLCLSGETIDRIDVVALWNPSLRKSLDIPKPIIVNASRPYWVNHVIGFGYDPIKHDYKIVSIVYRHKCNYVQVFELSTGDWKVVDIGIDLPYAISKGVRSFFLNGYVHWIGYDIRNYSRLIVRFDMRNNTMDVITGLPGYGNLGIFGNSLSILYFDGERSWCLWVMKEYGVESSWTKQSNIVLEEGMNAMVCFRQNGDMLYEKTRLQYHKTLASCNSQSNIIKGLNLLGNCGSFCVDTYTESLVLLKSLTKSRRSEDE